MNSTIKTCIAILLPLSITMVYCKAARKETVAVPKAEVPVVSYAKDIAPIMLQSCTPCHFPAEGKKKMLDTYEATADNIYDIIYRVELPPLDIKFMPFKGKKPPLTEAEIRLFKNWEAQKMPR